ncbi:MAG TPA: hypothetical protein IGR64_07340 [Leptolyngbyaceae cyanobacterium M65_K2018_010]|nr:hypothetical protein [Leptolyngbyaceae cyanobacterium M65_K2018_010]
MKPSVGLGLLALVGVAAGAGAGAAYYWQRATALPDWHSSRAAVIRPDEILSQGQGNLLQSKLATGEGVRYPGPDRVEILLTEADVNQLVLQGLAQTPQAAGLIQATQSINASLEGDRLRAGVVVNPADIPTQDLPPQAQRAVQQALNTVPMLGDRPLYLGIEGRPRIENGRLVLDHGTRIQVGRIQLSLADAARLTGLDLAQLNETINLALPQTGITLDGLEVINGEAVLRGVRR